MSTNTIDALEARPTGKQAARFIVVGGSSYLLNLGLYTLGLLIGLNYLVAAATAFVLGFAFNFLSNRAWTFDARSGAMGRQFARFCIVAGVVLCVDLLLLRVAVGELELPRLPAQALIVMLLAPLSFLGNRLWAFGVTDAPAPTA